ncbi:MAG: uroporphyrinogen-III synthase [Bacteroidota bacterium]|jgi:uroporphyrinogen-III synthase|nr:uroporphyrinogen-III synthase [Bacteroidota bacterium]
MQNNPKIPVLSTRPLDPIIINNAEARGITIDCIPFIETTAIINETIIQIIHELAQKKITAIFTSMNAVDAVTAQLLQIPKWDIYCLGGITKEKVIQFFGEKHFKGSAKSAGLLAEKIIEHQPSHELIFFCGDQRMDELPETLAANQFPTKQVIVYNTIQTPIEVSKNYQGIVFFSPSAVHSFFSANTIPLSTILFAIGKTTAATIQTYVQNKIITSEWPGKEQMIDLVMNYFKPINIKA